MKYLRHISKPEDVLVMHLKNSLAYSWAVEEHQVIIHHIAVHSNTFMVVSSEIRLDSGEIIFDEAEIY